MILAEKYKIVPVIASDDINAGVDADSINMKHAHRATFILMFGTLAGAGAVLTVNSGASDGAKTSPLTFRYAYTGADIGAADCDVLGAEATSAALTLTAATFSDRTLIIEINAEEMDVANGENWLTLSISNAADSGTVDGICVLTPRATGNVSATVLV